MNDAQMPDKGSVRDYVQTNKKQVTSDLGNLSIQRPDANPKLIIHSRIYHRDKDSQVKGSLTRSVRLLHSNEDAYIRKIIVGEQWIEVDTAWVKSIGMLRIQNSGTKPFNRQPTPEELQEELSRIIEVGYMLQPSTDSPLTRDLLKKDIRQNANKQNRRTMFDPPIDELATVSPIITLWEIHPLEHLEGKPRNEPIYLRCQHGEVTATIVAIPN